MASFKQGEYYGVCMHVEIAEMEPRMTQTFSIRFLTGGSRRPYSVQGEGPSCVRLCKSRTLMKGIHGFDWEAGATIDAWPGNRSPFDQDIA
jgi:hypothetical protein